MLWTVRKGQQISAPRERDVCWNFRPHCQNNLASLQHDEPWHGVVTLLLWFRRKNSLDLMTPTPCSAERNRLLIGWALTTYGESLPEPGRIWVFFLVTWNPIFIGQQVNYCFFVFLFCILLWRISWEWSWLAGTLKKSNVLAHIPWVRVDTEQCLLWGWGSSHIQAFHSICITSLASRC